MSTRRKGPKTLSDQLREIMEAGPVTRYRISKVTGIDGSQLSRFVHRKGDLSLTTLDKIGTVLRLRLVQDPEPADGGKDS